MHIMSEVNRLDIPVTLTMGHAKLQKRFTAATEHSHLLIAANYSFLTLYLDSSKGD